MAKQSEELKWVKKWSKRLLMPHPLKIVRAKEDKKDDDGNSYLAEVDNGYAGLSAAIIIYPKFFTMEDPVIKEKTILHELVHIALDMDNSHHATINMVTELLWIAYEEKIVK